MGHLNEAKVKEVKIGRRTILQITDGPSLVFSCWKEGPNVVLTIGSESPQRAIALAERKRENITRNAMFRRNAGFQKYETWFRGYINAGETMAIVNKEIPAAAALLKELGISDLKEISFHAGFDGKLQRSTLFVSLPKKRRGLLQLLSSDGKFSVEKLPPLPPDAAMVAAGTFDLGRLYSEAFRSIRLIATVVDPFSAKVINREFDRFEKSLGENIRRDLIGALGSNYVVYGSPSEGPLSLGTTIALQVQHPKKLQMALDALVRLAPAAFGTDVSLQKRSYRGATLNVVRIGERQFPFRPTFVIHKGWLVVSLYPQSVRGYVFRSGKNRRQWKRPPLLARALSESLKPQDNIAPKLKGVGVTDPRPTIKQLMSVAPVFLSILGSIPGSEVPRIDTSLIPNGQAATERLSENVSVTVDDGDGLRIEGYSTFPLPFQLTGLDVYSYAFIPFFLRGF